MTDNTATSPQMLPTTTSGENLSALLTLSTTGDNMDLGSPSDLSNIVTMGVDPFAEVNNANKTNENQDGEFEDGDVDDDGKASIYSKASKAASTIDPENHDNAESSDDEQDLDGFPVNEDQNKPDDHLNDGDGIRLSGGQDNVELEKSLKPLVDNTKALEPQVQSKVRSNGKERMNDQDVFHAALQDSPALLRANALSLGRAPQDQGCSSKSLPSDQMEVAQDEGSSSQTHSTPKKVKCDLDRLTEAERKDLSPNGYIAKLVKHCKTTEDVLDVCNRHGIQIRPIEMMNKAPAPFVGDVSKLNDGNEEENEDGAGDETSEKKIKGVSSIGKEILGVTFFMNGDSVHDNVLVGYQRILKNKKKDYITKTIKRSDDTTCDVRLRKPCDAVLEMTKVSKLRLDVISRYFDAFEIKRGVIDPSRYIIRDRYVFLVVSQCERFVDLVEYLKTLKVTETSAAKSTKQREPKKLSQRQEEAKKYWDNASDEDKAKIERFIEDKKDMMKKITHIAKNMKAASIYSDDVDQITHMSGINPEEFAQELKDFGDSERLLTKAVLTAWQELGFIKDGYYVYKNNKFPASVFFNYNLTALCQERLPSGDDEFELSTRLMGIAAIIDLRAREIMCKIISQIRVFLGEDRLDISEYTEKNFDSLVQFIKDYSYSESLIGQSPTNLVDSMIVRAYGSYNKPMNILKSAPNQLYKVKPDLADFTIFESIDEAFPKFDMPKEDGAKSPKKKSGTKRKSDGEDKEGGRKKRSKRAAPTPEKARKKKKSNKSQNKKARVNLAGIRAEVLGDNSLNFAKVWRFMLSNRTKGVQKDWPLHVRAVYYLHSLYLHDEFVRATVVVDPPIEMINGEKIQAKHLFKLSPEVVRDTFHKMKLSGVDNENALKMMKEVIKTVRQAYGITTKPNLNFDITMETMSAEELEAYEKKPIRNNKAIRLAFNIDKFTKPGFSQVSAFFLSHYKRFRSRYQKWVETAFMMLEKPIAMEKIPDEDLEKQRYNILYNRALKSPVHKIRLFKELSDDTLSKKFNAKKAESSYRKTEECKEWLRDLTKKQRKNKKALLAEEVEEKYYENIDNIRNFLPDLIRMDTATSQHSLYEMNTERVIDDKYFCERVDEIIEKNDEDESADKDPRVTIELYREYAMNKFNKWVEKKLAPDGDGNVTLPELGGKYM